MAADVSMLTLPVAMPPPLVTCTVTGTGLPNVDVAGAVSVTVPAACTAWETADEVEGCRFGEPA